MKQSFSLLIAFVFLQVQSWALSGGPVYPNNATSLSGTYAGTLVGDATFDATGNPAAAAAAGALTTNGAGIFIIGQPAAGLGSGVFAFFAQGVAYVGTAIALADPGEQKMSGIFDGQANVTSTVVIINPFTGLGTPTTTTTVLGLLAVTFTADIVQNLGQGPGGQSGTRLVGTGIATFTNPNAPNPLNPFIPISPPPVIGSSTIVIDGFLQSTTVTSTVDLSALTNTTGSSGG